MITRQLMFNLVCGAGLLTAGTLLATQGLADWGLAMTGGVVAAVGSAQWLRQGARLPRPEPVGALARSGQS